MEKKSLDDLASEFGDVLEVFEGGGYHKELLETLGDRTLRLRESLLARVYDYADAHEMLLWGLPEEAGTSDGDQEARRRLDRWRGFASYEFKQSALWCRLLLDVWFTWESVKRPEGAAVPDATVCGRFLDSLFEEEARRLGERSKVPAVLPRLLECRASAWRVVVEEVLKAMTGNAKPGRADYTSLQREHDVERSRFSPSWIFGLHCLRSRLKPEQISELDKRRELHKLNHELFEFQVATKLIEVPKKHLRRERARFDREFEDAIPVPKRLVAGLLWTSANLPLCLMKPTAATQVILAVLLERFGPKIMESKKPRVKGKEDAQGGGNEEGTRLRTLAEFTHDLRVMRNKRGLRPFPARYKYKDRHADLVTDLCFRRSGQHGELSLDDPYSFVSLASGSEGTEAEPSGTGSASTTAMSTLPDGTLFAELQLKKGIKVPGVARLRFVFGEGYDVKAVVEAEAGGMD